MMKSVFQFTHTTTNAQAHIIAEGCIFSLVNAEGLPVAQDEITSSPFTPILVMTAKKLGYKMTGIKQFEIVFEQVAEETTNQVHALVDAVVETVGQVAQVIETAAIEIQNMQDDDCPCVDQVISLKNMVRDSFKMVDQLQASLKFLTHNLDKCMSKLDDAYSEVQVAELFETSEQAETRIKEETIADAYQKAQILGLSCEIKDETFMMPYNRDRKPGIKDRLLVTYGKTEYLLIASEDEDFTLCQWYDRAGGKNAYTTRQTNLLSFLDTIHEDMVSFDEECACWEEAQF